ncbi:RanGTP-binding protein-domain-containing protein [Bisporella sp. PMI_857]|nr:RanGTP-binding protein-domain-containing protein [Bisporella sp. PMI_857]
MEVILGQLTSGLKNHLLRTGIAVTANYAIKQTSRLLKTVDNKADYEELRALQERLDNKISIISPAIDLIEIISAKGNTTLGSAISLTKAIRREIKSLVVRLANAADSEQVSSKSLKKAPSGEAHKAEIRKIIIDIQKLLARIEDAVPLINLAITTSGAQLSTSLPPSISPSRLLQASHFLAAGDMQYMANPIEPVQVAPTLTLSVYMLYAAHIHRVGSDTDNVRETTWKEVIHKARVKLLRVPLLESHLNENQPHLPTVNGQPSSISLIKSVEESDEYIVRGEGNANEFAYRLEIIEDFDDDRVHSFGDDEPKPGRYRDVKLAGIRESVPIHQISKIFYADTGKILGIGGDGETNNPVLLLKRDMNALPPRRMMGDEDQGEAFRYEDRRESFSPVDDDDGEGQDDIDQQIRRESSVYFPETPTKNKAQPIEEAWRFPSDLDPEWLALEVYTELEDSSSEDDGEINDDSAYDSHRPSSSSTNEPSTLTSDLSNLNLSPAMTSTNTLLPPSPLQRLPPSTSPLFEPMTSSLSLLEMLIRLTILQQFQQASHLTIPDELISFFLEDASTTGAGGDADSRRRIRREARQKVGFDPYDESPVKRRSEEYLSQNQYQAGHDGEGYGRSRTGTPYDEGDYGRQTRSPEPWLLRGREASSPREMTPSSPMSPYRPVVRKGTRPLDRVRGQSGVIGSPLGRGVSADTDSTLGTSPGSPTLMDGKEMH